MRERGRESSPRGSLDTRSKRENWIGLERRPEFRTGEVQTHLRKAPTSSAAVPPLERNAPTLCQANDFSVSYIAAPAERPHLSLWARMGHQRHPRRYAAMQVGSSRCRNSPTLRNFTEIAGVLLGIPKSWRGGANDSIHRCSAGFVAGAPFMSHLSEVKRGRRTRMTTDVADLAAQLHRILSFNSWFGAQISENSSTVYALPRSAVPSTEEQIS